METLHAHNSLNCLEKPSHRPQHRIALLTPDPKVESAEPTERSPPRPTISPPATPEIFRHTCHPHITSQLVPFPFQPIILPCSPLRVSQISHG
jgi:hypothetical protein